MHPGSVVFDRYLLEEQIGAGGAGVVWRATDQLLDQSVALKRVSLAGMDPQQAEVNRGRALREARLAARLRHHRHVVATYDVRVDDGDVWLVLEHVPARSLAQILRERGPLDPGQAARIGAQIADALAAAHVLGIEHRDVTPGNVLITDDGTAKLTDFGVSHLAGDTQLTQTGVVSGTFAYLAPEVARTGKSSAASDVFSLGATLYSAIEGQPPFGTADNALELLNIVSCGIVRTPTAAGAFTPLLMRLLDLNPTARLDAATARAQLDEFASPVTAPVRRQLTPTLRRRWLTCGRALPVIFALLLIGAFVLVRLLPIHGERDPSADESALPSTVGPIALTGEPRSADPCALIDLRSLRKFGQPFTTISYLPKNCDVRIATASGDTYLHVGYDIPAVSVADLGGTPQQLGDLTIARIGVISGLDRDFASYCRNVLVLADRTTVDIDTDGATPDLCAVTEVGTVTAVNRLARNGISYRPDRMSGLPIADSDACTLLDRPALSKIAGLDPNIRFPGFANWFCSWGAIGAGSRQASVYFALDTANVGNYGDPTTIAGRRGWLRTSVGASNPYQCKATVAHRLAPSATAATELVSVTVDAPMSAEDLCARATELITAAETTLPPSS